MEIKNLREAAERILKAIKDKERIILYGDADLDGATSLIILGETIRNLGWKVSLFHFPDRETEGYGITRTSLNYLKKISPALLIAMDCGIGNFEEVRLAKKMGFEVIIIDHHQVLDKLPEAHIVVDPQQKEDKYPFKELATVAISFKLAQLLLKDKMTQALRRNFLELVALATIADMMPQVGENKEFIEEGLLYMPNSWRPGIKAFFETDFLNNYTVKERVAQMISMLNVREVRDRHPFSFYLLTSSSLEEAKKIGQENDS
jgi:single-stranded-DNA-specific exonuclease